MKRNWLGGALVLVPAVLACGCSTMSNTEKGVGVGGLLGAGTGALIGSATHHAGAGAAIGAGVGALAGGLTGHAIDESERKTAAQVAAAGPPRGPFGMTDVVQLAQAHVSDDVIISQIRSTGSVFANLSANDTLWLKQNGVSDAVITEMLATANRVPRRVYSAAPVYVVEPPPPVSVGVGFGYYGGHRW